MELLSLCLKIVQTGSCARHTLFIHVARYAFVDYTATQRNQAYRMYGVLACTHSRSRAHPGLALNKRCAVPGIKSLEWG